MRSATVLGFGLLCALGGCYQSTVVITGDLDTGRRDAGRVGDAGSVIARDAGPFITRDTGAVFPVDARASCMSGTRVLATCETAQNNFVNLRLGTQSFRGDTSNGPCGPLALRCGGNTNAPRNPQEVYAFRVPEGTAPTQWRFATDNPGTPTDFDTVLEVRPADCLMSPQAVCDDDGGANTQSSVITTLTPGSLVFVVVGGFGTNNSGGSRVRSGPYELSVTSGPFPEAGVRPAFDGGF